MATISPFPELITGSEFPPKVVALVFDDGPDANTLALAQYLHDEKIAATFNVIGHNGQIGPNGYINYYILPQLVALGHRLSNHTFGHDVLPTLTPAEVLASIRTNDSYITQFVSNKTFLFTPPGGQWDLNTYQTIIGAPDLDKLIGPVMPDDFHGINAMDYSYAQQGLKAAKYASDFLMIYFDNTPPVTFPHIFLHDGNVYALGSDYAEVIARALVPRFKAEGYVFAAPVLRFSDISSSGQMPDSAGWINSPYYSSFRAADVDGDGLTDACMRKSDGIYCSIAHLSPSSGLGVSPTVSFSPVARWEASEFTDTHGWTDVRYSSTIQFGDVNGDGKADIVARNGAGIIVALANAATPGFQGIQYWSHLNSNGTYEFADSEGVWQTDASYYRTFQLADVNGDGKADLCVRGPGGIVCAVSTGSSFQPSSLWLGSEFSDAAGFRDVRYSTTIHFGDVNGDGKADVVGRNSAGIMVALANSRGNAFRTAQQWTAEFSDGESFWRDQESNYGTFRLADLNGDGRADLCARGEDGILCALSNGGSFTGKVKWKGDEFTNGLGWSDIRYSGTIMVGDINGDKRADIVARNISGIIFGFAP